MIQKDHRPARVRFSQPPGSVKLCCASNTADKRVRRGEGLSSESDTKLREPIILGLCRSYLSGRRPCGGHANDECSVDTPGSKVAADKASI